MAAVPAKPPATPPGNVVRLASDLPPRLLAVPMLQAAIAKMANHIPREARRMQGMPLVPAGCECPECSITRRYASVSDSKDLRRLGE